MLESSIWWEQGRNLRSHAIRNQRTKSNQQQSPAQGLRGWEEDRWGGWLSEEKNGKIIKSLEVEMGQIKSRKLEN